MNSFFPHPRPRVSSPSRLLLAATVGGLLSLVPTSNASAVSIIRDPHPPSYKVEIEPHLLLHPSTWHWGTGVGAGVRFSIPLMAPGFVKSINDSIAITLGADLVHYNGRTGYCYRVGNRCNDFYDDDFWAIDAPVAMQWNFWLTDSWSVFGEPGLVVRNAFYDKDHCGGDCNDLNIFPLFYAGGRYHFSDTTALTIRLGYPTLFSIGLSFF